MLKSKLDGEIYKKWVAHIYIYIYIYIYTYIFLRRIVIKQFFDAMYVCTYVSNSLVTLGILLCY